MTDTNRTITAVERFLAEHGDPATLPATKVRALFKALPERSLFDDVGDFVFACHYRAQKG